MKAAVLLLCFTLTASQTTTEPDRPRTSYEELCNGTIKCACPSATHPTSVVDCSGHDLAVFLAGIKFPDGVSTLHFQNNYFSKVPADAFVGGANVTTLDLSFNHISVIEPGALGALGSLITLLLANNRITTINVDELKGLVKLRILDLSHNTISQLFPEVFKACPDLKQLELDYNPLQYIDAEMFEYLPKLQILSLKSTGLQSLPDKLFEHNKDLNVLILDRNGLVDVPTVALQHVPKLKSLYLSGNQIERITAGAFSGLQKLVGLYLSEMKTLLSIEKFAFSNLTALEKFHCSFNPELTYIDPLAFKNNSHKMNLPNLTSVSFRECALDTLSKELLPYKNLLQLDLAENPWYCDCNLRWMLSLQKSVQEEIRCAGPASVENKLLSQLSAADMQCEGEVEYGVAVFVSVGLVVILVILLICLIVKMYRKGMFGGPPAKKYSRVSVMRDSVHYVPTQRA